MSVKNHPTTETKKPKNQSSTENAGTVLFFGFFFWFFGFLVFWFFGFLVVWFYCGEGYISKKPKKTKKQRTKKPKNQKTKKPKKQRTKNQKTKKKNKKPQNQNCSSLLRGALVFWFFGFGRRVVLHGHVRRVQTRYPGKSRLILILILS